ncbi:MAG: zinc ribbon domain-containing protein [Deltaproteobacteria bacterium]|nr:zinc ribbon domain-containing protein [Deltaproteobacteria bacterium]TLN01470.1 MAG: zinc ribbon domain-containing protein [bacterium]
MHCPKCGHEQPDGKSECQWCGVIFARIHPAGPDLAPTEPSPVSDPTIADAPLPALLKERLLRVDSDESRLLVAGRTVVYLVLLVWGFRLMTSTIDSNYVGESFLHLINLPFHEAGHLFFSPFGRFLQVLGGTLGQWLVPLAVLCAFLVKGNPFGASVGLWWLGESFLDIAPYMNDARAGQLILLGGVTGSEVEDYHDWEVLLTKLDWMQHDHLIARLTFAIGVVFMILALAWGGYLLVQQYKSSGRRQASR